MIALCMLVMIPGCDKFEGESFPDCVGIEGKFDPYNIKKAYDGRIWDQDTSFTTQFIFTEYTFDLRVMSKSWLMYFKRIISTTKDSYYSANCYRSASADIWFSKTYLDFNGHYTIWDFYFEEFDCSDLSGYINVIRPDIEDTVNYHFEASR